MSWESLVSAVDWYDDTDNWGNYVVGGKLYDSLAADSDFQETILSALESAYNAAPSALKTAIDNYVGAGKEIRISASTAAAYTIKDTPIQDRYVAFNLEKLQDLRTIGLDGQVTTIPLGVVILHELTHLIMLTDDVSTFSDDSQADEALQNGATFDNVGDTLRYEQQVMNNLGFGADARVSYNAATYIGGASTIHLKAIGDSYTEFNTVDIVRFGDQKADSDGFLVATDVLSTEDRTDASRDLIIGFSGNDQIFSGAGDDYLYGGEGSDLFRPGSGDDYIYGDEVTNTVTNSKDTVDYSISDQGHSPDHGISVVMDWETGAVVDGHRELVVTDDGTGGTDRLISIEAIKGTTKADTFLIKGSAGDNITLDGNGASSGSDSIYLGQSSYGYQVAINVSGDGYVRVAGASRSITLENFTTLSVFGSEQDDNISVDRPGADIWAGGGNDRVSVGSLDGMISGGSGGDTLDLSLLDNGASFSPNGTVAERGLDGLFHHMTVTEFEHVIGTSYNDQMFTDSSLVDINGAGGDDLIKATALTAHLNGGEGNDRISVFGAQVAHGGGGIDIFDISQSNGGTILIDGATTHTFITGGNHKATIDFSAADLTGAQFGVQESVDGVWEETDEDGGNVRVTHHTGTLDIRFANGQILTIDGLKFEAVTKQYWETDDDGISYHWGSPGGYLDVKVSGGDNLTFKVGDQTFSFKEFEQLENGGFVAATIDSAFGADVSWIGSHLAFAAISTPPLGQTELVGTSGDDTYVGSGDHATVSYAGVGHGVTVNLIAPGPQETGDGVDTFFAITGVVGSAYGDSLYAGYGGSTLSGASGDDQLFAGNGSDTIDGGDGTDTLKLAGVEADYSYWRAADGGFYVRDNASPDSIDLVRNVEVIQFLGDATLTDVEALAGGYGTASDDTVLGTSDDDYVYGLSGNDTLIAGTGNDHLIGGEGTDALIGGSGDDTYILGQDGSSDTIVENANEGTDTVESFATYTLGANLENLVLTGTTSIDGSGNELDNVITGNSGDNLLIGGAGNDTLVGAGGLDTLIGGTGNDIYYVHGEDTAVTENASEGADTVFSSESYSLGDNIEDLVLQDIEGGDETISVDGTGNELDNVITGSSGMNSLEGGGGNDVLNGGDDWDSLNGGEGDDVLNGGSGSDTAIFSGTFSDYTMVRNLDGTITVTDTVGTDGTDTLSSIETALFLGEFSMIDLISSLPINGTASGDVITGTDFDDYINGFEGDDLITSAGGNDTIDGGEGEDTVIFSGQRSDYVFDRSETGEVWVYANDYTTYTYLQNVEAVRFDGNVTLSMNVAAGDLGTEADDALLLGTAFDDTLWGLGGSDILAGLQGDDYIFGGDGVDQVNYSGGAEDYTFMRDSDGSVIIISDVTNEGMDYLIDVENVHFDGDDSLHSLTSLVSDYGTEDADLLISGTNGKDGLYGLAGNDVLIGFAGDDLINGGDGVDQANYLGDSIDYTITRNLDGSVTVTDNVGIEGTDTLWNVEVAYFGGDSTTVDILDIPLQIDGTNADDTIDGTTGKDIISAMNGDDAINAGGGNDTIDGGDGTDLASFTGGFSDYSIAGNLDGTVTISDLAGSDGTDILSNIENLHFAGDGSDLTVEDAVLLANGGTIDQYGTSDFDWLEGSNFSDRLYGLDSDDVLYGHRGNDLLYGGDGTDTAHYAGVFENFSFVANMDGTITITDLVGDEGSDTLDGVEHLFFEGDSKGIDTPDALELFSSGTIEVVGTTASDVMYGTEWNDTLRGEGGADQFHFSEGDDTYVGGSGTDQVEYVGDILDYNVTANPDGTYSVEDLAFGNGTDTLDGVENLYFLTGHLVMSIEDAFDISSGHGIDQYGTEDHDILGNWFWKDNIYGLGGNDNIAAGEGDDYIDGGEGVDVYQTSGFISEYAISVANGVITVTDLNTDGIDEGTDTLVNMETILFLGQVGPISFTDLLSSSNRGVSTQSVEHSLAPQQYDDVDVVIPHHLIPIESVPSAFVHDYML